MAIEALDPAGIVPAVHWPFAGLYAPVELSDT